MKAIQVHQFGGPKSSRFMKCPHPSRAGEVLVRVRAAGVNPYDTYMRNGAYPVKPALPILRLRRGGHDRGRRRGRHQSKTGRPRLHRDDAHRRLCRICAGAREPGLPAAEKISFPQARALGALRNCLYGLAPPRRCARWRNTAHPRRQRRRGHRAVQWRVLWD